MKATSKKFYEKPGYYSRCVKKPDQKISNIKRPHTSYGDGRALDRTKFDHLLITVESECQLPHHSSCRSQHPSDCLRTYLQVPINSAGCRKFRFFHTFNDLFLAFLQIQISKLCLFLRREKKTTQNGEL